MVLSGEVARMFLRDWMAVSLFRIAAASAAASSVPPVPLRGRKRKNRVCGSMPKARVAAFSRERSFERGGAAVSVTSE